MQPFRPMPNTGKVPQEILDELDKLNVQEEIDAFMNEMRGGRPAKDKNEGIDELLKIINDAK